MGDRIGLKPGSMCISVSSGLRFLVSFPLAVVFPEPVFA
jgi:hypothetical protein